MRSKFFSRHMLILICLLPLSLSACLPEQAGVVATASPSSSPTGMIEVVYVKDGNIHVWDEATRQTRTILDTGDVFSLAMSDNGQMVAFTRGSWVGEVLDGYEQSALWVMDSDGGNPRELISAQDLRERINPGERESSIFYQLSWMPQSDQLLFSGTKYIFQAEGLSHALPQGVYLVDTDTGSVNMLADAAENLHFLPSPDGRQIALMSPTSLDFINADGSNKRQDVLTYSDAGLTGPLFPTGAWTQDSSAFVMTGSFGGNTISNVNFSIWRIPMDGSSPQALATITNSSPSSVTFSPDGKRASYLQTTDQEPYEIAGWFITSLMPEGGALALPYYGKEASFANLHWSPAGEAFVIKDQALLQLCPDATDDSQTCGEPINLGSNLITGLKWVDTSRFLFVSQEPNGLSLANVDGTIIPIATWNENQRWEEHTMISGWSFTIHQ